MKPNFLLIGAMKSATTSLFNALGRHPQFFVSNPKEPEFFCKDEIFARGWPWYESMFADAVGRIAIGEASTSYTKQMLFPRTAERIATHLPDARLVYIVREPLERILSHWLHLSAEVREMPPLSVALERWPHIIDTSLYWTQISAYRRYYPDDRILVLFFEDLVERPAELLRRCYAFLGVDPKLGESGQFRASHISAQKRLDGPLIRGLQRLPFARKLKAIAPDLARAIMPMFRRPLPSRPEWPPGLRREVSARLEADMREFLEFYGRPGLWRIE